MPVSWRLSWRGALKPLMRANKFYLYHYEEKHHGKRSATQKQRSQETQKRETASRTGLSIHHVQR